MMRTLKRIIVHHSASDNPNHDDIEVIRNWHVNENGWADVGYHFLLSQMERYSTVVRYGV